MYQKFTSKHAFFGGVVWLVGIVGAFAWASAAPAHSEAAPTRARGAQVEAAAAPPPAPAPGAGPSLAAVERRLAELDQRQAELAGEVDLLASDVVPTEPAAPRSLEDLLARSEAERQANIGRLHRAWADQPTDPAWASEASAAVSASLAGVVEQGKGSLDIECRSSMCRLRVEFVHLDARSEVMSGLPTTLPWTSEGFYHAEDGHPERVEVFVAREGMSLPRG
jgi:hypothetical protein